VAEYKESSSELSSEEEAKPATKKAKVGTGKVQKKAEPAPKKKTAPKKTKEDHSDADDVTEPATGSTIKKAPAKKREPKIDLLSEESLKSHPCRCGPPASLGPDAKKESKYHGPDGPTHRIGAHTSAAGGIENALVNASQLGGRALALFLKNQRKWESSPLDEEGVKKFRKLMLERDMGGEYPGIDIVGPKRR
jgi:AP endonuclease-1